MIRILAILAAGLAAGSEAQNQPATPPLITNVQLAAPSVKRPFDVRFPPVPATVSQPGSAASSTSPSRLVCGTTVIRVDAGADPRIVIRAPAGRYAIRKIAPPVCAE